MISKAKSYTPDEVNNSRICGEFAKRLFIQEGELSPLPFNLFKRIKSKTIRDGMLLANYMDRGFSPDSLVSKLPSSNMN